jgi:hypothetical protein
MEIKQSSSLQLAKKENALIPQALQKGRKPEQIKDAFRSQIVFV